VYLYISICIPGNSASAPIESEDSLLLAQLLSQEADISDNISGSLKARRQTIMDEIEFFERDRQSESTTLVLPQVQESLTIVLPLSAQEQLIRKADMISKLIIALEQKEEV
jgi:hypothetical protein